MFHSNTQQYRILSNENIRAPWKCANENWTRAGYDNDNNIIL